jgi:hypothetical protein
MDDMETCSEGMRELGEEEVVDVSPPPYTTTTTSLLTTPLSPMCETSVPTPADLMLDIPYKEPSPKYLKDK